MTGLLGHLPGLTAAVPDATPASLWVLVLIFAVGVLGIVFPVLPGLLICLGTVLVWALDVGGTRAWVTFGLAALIYAVGVVLQLTIPGRKMKAEGVGGWTIVLGLLAAVVGFFVVPIVGAPLFFVLGVFLVEYSRYRERDRAWAATQAAIRGVLRSIGVELAAAMAIATTWTVGILSHSV